MPKVSIEVSEELFQKCVDHANRHGREEGQSVVRFILADAMMYRKLRETVDEGRLEADRRWAYQAVGDDSVMSETTARVFVRGPKAA